MRVGTIREYAKSQSNPELTAAFNEAVAAMEMLRQFHMGVATKYLIRTNKGTGESTFRGLLKEHINDTNQAGLDPAHEGESCGEKTKGD